MRARSHTQNVWRPALGAAAICLACSAAFAQDVPMEPADPLFDLDWSVALRGSYVSDSASGAKANATLAPRVSLTAQGGSSRTRLDADAELAIDSAGAARISRVHSRAESSYALGENTTLTGAVDLSLRQLGVDDSSADLPANTAIAPYEIAGETEGSATTRLGLIDVTGRASARRFIDGPTTLDDGTVIDNANLSYWRADAGLRAGFEISPVLAIFADAGAGTQAFDAASPTLLTYLDNRLYVMRGGLSFRPNAVVTGEVSAGRAWLDYVDPSLTDAAGWVYDANVSFAPDEAIAFTAGLTTTLGPSDTVAGDTDIDYALTGSASYRINPWLQLRGSAGWTGTQTVAAASFSSGYSAGAGFDLSTSEHSVWSGDYLFEHGDSDTHTVTLGLTIKR